MPPKKARRQSAAEKWQSFTSSVLPRPTGRPRKDGAGNVSLSSTVGAPTPARSRKAADDSLASTLATSTPAAVPTQRGRPRKHALTTPGSRALTSADTTTIASTSYSVVAPAARPQGRLSKSKLSAPQSRANVSSSNSASFSDQYKRRGRPPKNASDASTSVSQSMPKRRGRPSESVNKLKSTQIGLPRSQSSKAPRYVRPEVEQASGSEVSLIDGASDEDDDASEVDHDQSGEEEEALSSEDEARQASTTRKKSKRKGWPSEIERLRKGRRLSVEERECVTSEGGLIWRTAIPLLNSMPKNIRSMVADSLTRALNRIDGKLESGLVPPLARIPQGTTAASATRRDLASSMLSWRLEEEASLLRAENPAQPVDVMELGLNGDILELEQMLLPEAEHIVELSKTLTHQSEHLEQSSARIAKLKRDRRLIKSTGSTDYPANLEANELLSVTNQSAALDPKLSSFLRLAHRA